MRGVAIHQHTFELGVVVLEFEHFRAQSGLSPAARVDLALAKNVAEAKDRSVEVAMRLCPIEPAKVGLNATSGTAVC